MWGAFGNPPDSDPPATGNGGGAPAKLDTDGDGCTDACAPVPQK